MYIDNELDFIERKNEELRRLRRLSIIAGLTRDRC